MSADLSKYNLSDPDEFIAASGEVAESIADTLDADFTRIDGDNVFVNVKAIEEFTRAGTLSGMVLMITGEKTAAAEVLKFVVSLNAIVNEAKVREGVKS